MNIGSFVDTLLKDQNPDRGKNVIDDLYAAGALHLPVTGIQVQPNNFQKVLGAIGLGGQPRMRKLRPSEVLAIRKGMEFKEQLNDAKDARNRRSEDRQRLINEVWPDEDIIRRARVDYALGQPEREEQAARTWAETLRRYAFEEEKRRHTREGWESGPTISPSILKDAVARDPYTFKLDTAAQPLEKQIDQILGMIQKGGISEPDRKAYIKARAKLEKINDLRRMRRSMLFGELQKPGSITQKDLDALDMAIEQLDWTPGDFLPDDLFADQAEPFVPRSYERWANLLPMQPGHNYSPASNDRWLDPYLERAPTAIWANNTGWR